MISAGHWKIVGTDFSSLSPLSPLAPQLIQFCFSMGSTEWVLSCCQQCSFLCPYRPAQCCPAPPSAAQKCHLISLSGTIALQKLSRAQLCAGRDIHLMTVGQDQRLMTLESFKITCIKKKNNCYYCIYSIHICEGMSPSWLLIQNTKIPAGWSMWRSKHPQKSPWWALLPGCLGWSSCLGISALLPGHGTDLASSPCTPC